MRSLSIMMGTQIKNFFRYTAFSWKRVIYWAVKGCFILFYITEYNKPYICLKNTGIHINLFQKLLRNHFLMIIIFTRINQYKTIISDLTWILQNYIFVCSIYYLQVLMTIFLDKVVDWQCTINWVCANEYSCCYAIVHCTLLVSGLLCWSSLRCVWNMFAFL